MAQESSSSGPHSPTQVVATKDVVTSIVTCILAITSLIAVVARFAVKWTTSKTLHVDDFLIFLALVSTESEVKGEAYIKNSYAIQEAPWPCPSSLKMALVCR